MNEFITDMGSSNPVVDQATGETIMMLPRYAVWGDLGSKPEVIETSSSRTA